jgi:hypothetical protein
MVSSLWLRVPIPLFNVLTATLVVTLGRLRRADRAATLGDEVWLRGLHGDVRVKSVSELGLDEARKWLYWRLMLFSDASRNSDFYSHARGRMRGLYRPQAGSGGASPH